MANVLAALIRSNKVFCSRTFLGQTQSIIFKSQAIRNLYSKTTLGLDTYLDQRNRTINQLVNIAPKFREKMKEYASEDSKNMVFTEDLKNMLHLVDNDDDIELVIKMLKKFNQQNKQLRFGNYIFGPVIMRMFYTLNKPDEALACFKSPEMDGLFDQLITYQILLDLLYEHKKYNEMLDCFKVIQERQIDGIKFAKNPVVLVFAACYKINTKESLDYALKLWKELIDIGHLPMRRAVTFCAGLAINQGKPEVALEILSSVRNQNYTTVRNLKASALTALGRLDEAVVVLKSILNEDSPSTGPVHTFNKDVINQVKEAVEKSGTTETKAEFNRVEKYLQQQGQIYETPLHEQLCDEIAPPPVTGKRSDDAFTRRPRFSRFQRDSDSKRIDSRKERMPFPRRLRPGLTDLQ